MTHKLRNIHSRAELRAAAAAVAVALLTLSACSSSTGDATDAASDAKQCERGDTTVEKALTGFFSAVVDNDTEAAEKFLNPVNTVDPNAFDNLREALVGEEVSDLKMVDLGHISTNYPIEVFTGNGELIGQFNVYDKENGCFAVSWGISPRR